MCAKVARRWSRVEVLAAFRSWLIVTRADKEAFRRVRKAQWIKFFRYWREVWREGKQHRLLIAVKKGVREGVLRGEMERRRFIYRRLWRVAASSVLHQKRMRREMAYAFKCDLRRASEKREYNSAISDMRRRSWRLAIKACEWHVAAKVARRMGYEKQSRMRDEIDELRNNMFAQERLKSAAEASYEELHDEIHRLHKTSSDFDTELTSVKERLARSRWRMVYRFMREDKFRVQSQRTREVAGAAVRKAYFDLRNSRVQNEKEDTTLRAEAAR